MIFFMGVRDRRVQGMETRHSPEIRQEDSPPNPYDQEDEAIDWICWRRKARNRTELEAELDNMDESADFAGDECGSKKSSEF